MSRYSLCWFKGPSLNRPEITSGNENKGAGAPPEGESQTPYPCRPCWGHLEVKCVLSRCRLRARRQRRGSRHTVFSAGILQGACGIIPRGLQIGSGRQVIPLFSSSRLGPLSPGWLWPLGPKSGSPQRVPPTPETAPGSRGSPPPLHVIQQARHLFAMGQCDGENTKHFSDQLCCYSFQRNGMPAALAGDVPAPRPLAWAGPQARKAARGTRQPQLQAWPRPRPRRPGARSGLGSEVGAVTPPTQVPAAEEKLLQRGELGGVCVLEKDA